MRSLYAHRGLHDGNKAIPENSMQAFQLAIKNGFGIELDVQLTKDKQLIVHHDSSLKRVCGVDKQIRDLTYEELCRIPLPNGETIPLFSELLHIVNGRVPLIVEIKYHGSVIENAAAAWKLLKDYKGAYCIESFHPAAVSYFRKNAPQVIRGQLASGGKWEKSETSWLNYFALKYLLINVIGRPHFVAYSVSNDNSLSIWLMRHVFKPILAAWTIRSQPALDDARKKGYRYPIFELFFPDK